MWCASSCAWQITFILTTSFTTWIVLPAACNSCWCFAAFFSNALGISRVFFGYSIASGVSKRPSLSTSIMVTRVWSTFCVQFMELPPFQWIGLVNLMSPLDILKPLACACSFTLRKTLWLYSSPLDHRSGMIKMLRKSARSPIGWVLFGQSPCSPTSID